MIRMTDEVADQAALNAAFKDAMTRLNDPDTGFFGLTEDLEWSDIGYVGVDEDAAVEAAERHGIAEIRVFRLPFRSAYRLDHMPERLNLAISQGQVIRAAFF